MALEATKAMAFSSACDLLHLLLIENHESICLLPRFATCPTDLHVAAIQALLSLATSVKSFDRPYLSSLADLLLDLFVFLRKQTAVPMAAFTQQMILTELLQSILSPVVQQRHDERSCRLRGQLYLPLLSFLTSSRNHRLTLRIAVQQNAADLLVQPLQTALSLLVPSLAQDALLSDLQSRATALALLRLLLQSDLGEETLRLLLREKETIQVGVAVTCHRRRCCSSSRTWTRVCWRTRRWLVSSAKCTISSSL